MNIKRFDIYRKLPKDLTQPTTTGALISIFSTFFIIFLLVSEVLSFLQEEVISELYVDDPTTGATIPVIVDLEIPNMACDFLGIDIQDNQGRHEVGYMKNTRKTDIINKIHDFNHKINKLFFGEDLSALELPGNQTTLAGKSTQNEAALSYDYTLKIVPTVHTDNKRQTKFGYQYTVTSKTFKNTRGTPAIWFRYEIAPITVKYTHKKKPFYHLLTTVCAIVGGTFTVAGMVDSMIFSAHQAVKKASEGKLG
ncbi:Oidioi.mRNA.OKI2018_I69.XSR.g15534.t1.cds [Oikopleura dioica]|uniref:Oidioi.mRNA.OKI2018_I69.XSR.g15534.t1.cds n=1 Tax=Oikopleura dioica TaxID=34765 RepID=A0ABN7SKK6_OIKDI|nr:Oidioi.mRNA.OKI2018_I69.XSR.g15534.t1.cds [Oikopleura dioica]